jgi:hypothetical protein
VTASEKRANAVLLGSRAFVVPVRSIELNRGKTAPIPAASPAAAASTGSDATATTPATAADRFASTAAPAPAAAVGGANTTNEARAWPATIWRPRVCVVSNAGSVAPWFPSRFNGNAPPAAHAPNSTTSQGAQSGAVPVVRSGSIVGTASASGSAT